MAATGVLGRMLAGVSMTRTPQDPDEPDFSATEIEPCGEHGVRMVLVMPSGDHYEVIVDWLEEESP